MNKKFIYIIMVLVAAFLARSGYFLFLKDNQLITEGSDKVYFHIPYNANHFTDPEKIISACSTLGRHLSLMNKYEIKTDYYFSWLAYKMVKKNCPEHLVTLKKSGMHLAHHGANRDPQPQLIDRVKGENWEEDLKIVKNYETHDIDPEMGELLNVPGGLSQLEKDWSEVFATGRFFQSTILKIAQEYGVKMAVGLKDNTGAGTNQAWFMGALNRPEVEALGVKRWIDWSLGKPFQGEDIFNSLDFMIQEMIKKYIYEFPLAVITMHDHDFFQRSEEDNEKIWQGYEALIKHLVESEQVKFVSLSNIYNLAIDDREKTITKEDLSQAVEYYFWHFSLKEELPEYIELYNNANFIYASDYLSLTDFFQALVYAIQYYDEHGDLSEKIEIKDILGPTQYYKMTGDLEIERDQLIKIVRDLEIGDKVPAVIEREEKKINSASFLYLLAKLYQEISTGGSSDYFIAKNIEMFPENQKINDKADNLTKLQFWTYKPARFEPSN